jgi:hypothetical protein
MSVGELSIAVEGEEDAGRQPPPDEGKGIGEEGAARAREAHRCEGSV